MSVAASHPEAPLLAVEELGIRYGALRAVDGLTFEVDPGQVVALIGPNGSGKTSAFNAITGYVPAAAGRVTLDGCDILGRARHEIAQCGVSRTFQRLSVFGTLDVRTNLEIALRTRAGERGVEATAGAADGDDEVVEIAARAGVRDLDATAGSLSYGAQRKLAVAMALARKPRLLMLDEPAAGLDLAERRELSGVIAGAGADGVAVLLVEHDVALIMELADRVIVLASGRPIADGSAQDVRDDPVVVEAYLGRRRGGGAARRP